MSGTGADVYDRLARLEEDRFFQERLLRDLSDALAMQQRQLDAMGRLVEELRADIEEMHLLMEQGGPINAPPPHYM